METSVRQLAAEWRTRHPVRWEMKRAAAGPNSGPRASVNARRSESADAPGIEGLMGPSARAVFGPVNVLQLLEKANLAVTLANEEDDILAHASFLDHPVGDLVDAARWETFLHKHFRAETCTPLNTLFLHLFVAQPNVAAASVKEIMRIVFTAVTELEYICLMSSNVSDLEPALNDTFEPLQCRKDPPPRCLAFICHRRQHCPKLHIRPARVEDHDDILSIIEQQKKLVPVFDQPESLAELIQAQDEKSHTAVCEVDGVAVGFVSISADGDVKKLCDSFELADFNCLLKPLQTEPDEPVAPSDSSEAEELRPDHLEATQPTGGSSEEPNAFWIHFFVIDKKHEMRSVDFIPYVFQLFPDLDFCIIIVPPLSAEFPLLQSFFRVPPRAACPPSHELYILHRVVLSPVQVRPAVAADRPAVADLTNGLTLSESLLQDLDHFYRTRSGPDRVELQAFVAQVDGRVVGILVIWDEQDIEYIRAHYNIENFIYFSHHRYEEHAQIRHFVLNASFQHVARHLFKEVLRLAHRSCLYHRIYPQHHSQENSCVHHLEFILRCAVPVRPRRQIIYPLEELGMNGPSRRISEEQAPFALCLISRKLTLEPKVAINARTVVVGASDTGLSFLEVLCLCPHLRFNNLTLISTHGFPGDWNHEDIGFLSTSHAYSGRDLAQLPLRPCISVVSEKMVGINRTSRHVQLSGGGKVPYDHLFLCTGLQYQVPCPSGVDLGRPATKSELQTQHAAQERRRYTQPVPANLLTLSDLRDCAAARRWLRANFMEQEDNAIVYGNRNNIDVYTTVETLLSLGVSGSRIHVVLLPPEPGVSNISCFSDPSVERGVATAMRNAEVHVHRNCLLVQMNDCGHPDPLTSVTFSTEAGTLRLHCGVFLNLSNKGVDSDAFRSFSSSFLVFDGRLVIDANFHTSDSAICSAGPVTKFSRRYHTEEWSHANFNSREVGRHLAATMLARVDPTQDPADEPPLGTDRLPPLYKQAKIQGGKLPGGHHYLRVTKPSATILLPRPVQHDRCVVTGRAETGNYFCLHLDSNELVETLTCFSLKPFPVSNYLCLYGKHQQLLGQLSTRYSQALVHDLYSFFTQSCCLVVYHDRFSDFEQELQQITSQKPKHDGGGFEDTQSRAALRSGAVKYLTYNRNLLPMFAGPGQW